MLRVREGECKTLQSGFGLGLSRIRVGGRISLE